MRLYLPYMELDRHYYDSAPSMTQVHAAVVEKVVLQTGNIENAELRGKSA